MSILESIPLLANGEQAVFWEQAFLSCLQSSNQLQFQAVEDTLHA